MQKDKIKEQIDRKIARKNTMKLSESTVRALLSKTKLKYNETFAAFD